MATKSRGTTPVGDPQLGTTMPVEEAILSPQLAFVVQFRTPANSGRFAGRVEHMASGRALRFSSSSELVQWLTRTVRDSRRNSHR